MSDVMTELGWKPKGFAGKATKGVLGFAADVATDPLTYMGVGLVSKASKALKLAKKAGNVKWVNTLGWVDDSNKAIQQFKHLDKFGKIKKGSNAERMMRAGMKAGAKPREINASVTFMGKSIAGTEKVANAFISSIDKLNNLIRKTPGLGKGIDKFRSVAGKLRPSNIGHVEWEKWLKVMPKANALGREITLDNNAKLIKLRKLIATEGLDEDRIADITHAIETGITKPKSKSAALAIDIRKDLADKYKDTLGKDISTDSVKHVTHVLARNKYVNKVRKADKEFIDSLGDGRQIQGFKGSIPNTPLKGDYIINLNSGKVFKGLTSDNGVPLPLYTLRDNELKAVIRGDIGKLSQATAKDINKGMGIPLFDTDIINVLEATTAETARIAELSHLIKSAKGLSYDVKDIPKKVKTIKLSKELMEAVPEFADKRFPKEIGEHLNKSYELFNNPKKKHEAIRKYDNILNFWKKTATLVNPPFHIRNLVTNVIQNSIADVWKPIDYIVADKIQRFGRKNIDKLSVFERKILKEFDTQGLGHTGYLSGEFGDDTIKAIHKNWNLIGKGWSKAESIGMAAGKRIEDNAKLAHFIAKRKAGLSASEAANSVKKYLFDYDDVTDAEKWIKRVIPFYTWSRKNIPLQLETLIKKPSKQTRIIKLKNNIEVMAGTDEDRKLLPDWVKDSMPVFIGKRNGKSRYITLDGLIPIGDLAKISDPAKEMINMLSPVLKAPVEQMANYNFFFGNKITGNDSTTIGNWAGEKDFFNTRIPGRLEHLARLFRPITEIEKIVGLFKPEWSRKTVDKDWDEKLQRTIIGSVVYGEDTKRLRKMFNRSAGKEVANLQKQINLLRQQSRGAKNKAQIIKDIKDLRKLLRKANKRKRDKKRSVR